MGYEITVCMGSSCFARGNATNLDIIEKYLREHPAGRVRLEGGEFRSDQLFRTPLPVRFIFCQTTPGDRQGQRVAAIPIAATDQHHSRSAALIGKQFILAFFPRIHGNVV